MENKQIKWRQNTDMQIFKVILDVACESCFPVILVGEDERLTEHQSCFSQHVILCSTQQLP